MTSEKIPKRGTVNAVGAERRVAASEKEIEMVTTVQEAGDNADIESAKGHVGGMPQRTAVVSVCNTLLGSGVLALASTVQEVGTVGFALCVTAAALAAHNTHVYLFRCCFVTKTSSLESLGRAAFRHWGAQLAAGGVIVQGFGSLSSYTIIIADLGTSLAGSCAGILEEKAEDGAYAASDSLTLGSGLPNRTVICWLAVGCLVLPLALLPTVSALKRISQLGVAVFVMFVAVTAVICATATPRAGQLRFVPDDVVALLLNAPTLLFALNSHHTILNVFAELQPAPGKSVLLTAQEVSRSAYVVIWAIYMLVGNLGYWAYRDSTLPNLLMNMPPSLLIVALRGMMVLSIIAGYPSIHFAVRRAQLSLLLGPDHPAVNSASFSAPQVAITLLTVSCITVFALALPGLKTAFALTGATATSFLMLVFPPAVFLRLHRKTLRSAEVLVAAGHIATGLLVAVLCVGAQLSSSHPASGAQPRPAAGVVQQAASKIVATVPQRAWGTTLPMRSIVT